MTDPLKGDSLGFETVLDLRSLPILTYFFTSTDTSSILMGADSFGV